jgi:ATP-binding cassette subfamily A (ABC1) protein 3
METVKEWVRQRIPGVQLDKWGSRDGGHGQLRFKVLKTGAGSKEETKVASETAIQQVSSNDAFDLNSIPGLIQLLETHREELSLEYYSVSPTTLDEVFLRVVGEEEEEDAAAKKKSGGKGLSGKLKFW